MTDLSNHYVCSICGDEHDGLVTDWAYKMPDVVWQLPEHERAERARFNDDLCQFGERYFIRCILEVPLIGANDRFGWGAWAEVEWATFERYLELYDEDGLSEPVRSGWLANQLAAYADTLGAPVNIQFREPDKRPSLHLDERDESALAAEQRRGIDDARYHEILKAIGRLTANC